MVKIAICDDERSVVDDIENHILTYGKLNSVDLQILNFMREKHLSAPK